MKAATDKLSLALRAIADPTRRKILRLLRSNSSDGMCASDIEHRIKLAQPTVSHHMKILKQANLIETSKTGTWVHYKRNEPALRKIKLGIQDEL